MIDIRNPIMPEDQIRS